MLSRSRIPTCAITCWLKAVPLEAAGFRQRVLAQSHNPPVIDRDEVHLRLMLDYA